MAANRVAFWPTRRRCRIAIVGVDHTGQIVRILPPHFAAKMTFTRGAINFNAENNHDARPFNGA